MVSNRTLDALMSYSSGTEVPKSKGSSKAGRVEVKSVYEPRNDKPSERLLKSISDSNFDLTQMEKVFRNQGKQQVVSGAGSGKTSAMTFKVLYDQARGVLSKVVDVNGRAMRVMDSVLVCTFLRTGAQELKSHYKLWSKEFNLYDASQFIQFRTLHAEFKAALEAMGMHVSIIDGSTNTSLLRKSAESFLRASGVRMNSDTVNDLETALSRTRNLLSSERYKSTTYDELGLYPRDIDTILEDWADRRHSMDKLDFEDLQEVLYQLVCVRKDESAVEYVRSRYRHIYIDEFQDTSEIQYEILKEYFHDAKTVLAVGDDDQTIYSWRGSSVDIITKRFSEDFAPKKTELTINYRCPSVVLESVKPSISLNENRLPKNLESSRKGGSVDVVKAANHTEMSKYLLKGVEEDLSDGRSVMVLCRVNYDGFLPALTLAREGYGISIGSSQMTFDNSVGRLALRIPRLMHLKYGTEVSTSLKHLIWDKYEVDTIMRACKEQGLFAWELDRDDLEYSAPTLAPHVKRLGELIGPGSKSTRVLSEVYGYFIRDLMNGKSSQYTRMALGVLNSVKELLDTQEYSDILDFRYDLEDIADILKSSVGSEKAKVKVSTVHEQKGKEADSVYIWNDSEGMFPHDKSDNLEEERKIHYIACTRASERLTILTNKFQRSPFLSEMDLSEAREVVPDPVSRKLT